MWFDIQTKPNKRMPKDEQIMKKKKRRSEASRGALLCSSMFEAIARLFPICDWYTRFRESYAFVRFKSRCKFWKHQTLVINPGDLTYNAIYLGNVPTFWAKGDQSVEAPLRILWKNYERKKGKKAQTKMKVTVCNSGMKVFTREVGNVEYWSNRITFVTTVPTHPRVFFWVYRHTGKRGKPDLRCHAVLCHKSKHSRQMADELQVRLFNAFREFRREINLRQNAPNNTLPVRKKFLVKGMLYFKQPLERSQSAPKLDSIFEDETEEAEEATFNNFEHPLFCVSTGQLNF